MEEINVCEKYVISTAVENYLDAMFKVFRKQIL